MEKTLYHDIQARTNGEIYIGVVGPVRTGKSTFIKRFMEVCVLEHMEDTYAKNQAVDELPQSGGGKTIMTTEPKFIPSEAAEVCFSNETKAKIRLIDCVGYMVDGAIGHMEGNQMRMVKTPWTEEEIPFTQAAEIGTKKVIEDHSTVGIVVTTDGSFTGLEKEEYEAALEKTIHQLKEVRKPFLVLLNSERPYSNETKSYADQISKKYQVTVLPGNLAQLKKTDIHEMMNQLLLEFPIHRIHFQLPGWTFLLRETHPFWNTFLQAIREKMQTIDKMQDLNEAFFPSEDSSIWKGIISNRNMADGTIDATIHVQEVYYYGLLSELLGEEVTDELEFFELLTETAQMKQEYEQVRHALESVRQKGYGVVTPTREEITLKKPEIIHQGNKYGVKMLAQSPSIHMIRANIETEIAPIVGTREQAEDLICYIESGKETQNGSGTSKENESVWETNIFGKTVEQMIQDGIQAKIAKIGEDSQIKLQDTMQKIVNETTGGLICIIL